MGKDVSIFVGTGVYNISRRQIFSYHACNLNLDFYRVRSEVDGQTLNVTGDKVRIETVFATALGKEEFDLG